MTADDEARIASAIRGARSRTDPARSAEVIRAYEAIYFPAQRIHFAEDEPQAGADLIAPSDDRLTAAGAPSGGPPP